MPAAGPARQLEWAPRALEAYLATLARIADEDPFTAQRFLERVEHSLAVILSQPAIGTPATRRGERRYPIPNTGHVINYRLTRNAVRIQLWYRARQQSLRR
jgi:plasmid stabilization system protein ParE